MKKLIMAVAIVCAAVAAQAASVNWEGFDIADINGDLYTGSAFLHCVEIDSITSTGSIVDGELTGPMVTDDLLVAGSTYNFYFTSTDANGNVYTSEILSAKMAGVGAGSIGFEGAGTWTPAPEPTSGMLLLLGIAGLALRRKQK